MAMASLELILSESEWQNLLSLRHHTKQLFDVDLRRKDGLEECECDCASDVVVGVGGLATSVLTSHNHNISCSGDGTPAANDDSNEQFSDAIGIPRYVLRAPPVIVVLETKNRSSLGLENLEKCKKFACACTPSHPDFKFLSLHVGNQHSLEMVQARCAHIQQSTAALINLNPERLVITIQGHHSCVEAARDKVNMILVDGLKLKPTEKNGQIQYYDANLDYAVPFSTEKSENNLATLGENSSNEFCSVTEISPTSKKATTQLIKSDDDHSGIKDKAFDDQASFGNPYNFPPICNTLREENEEPPTAATNHPFQRYTESYNQNNLQLNHRDNIHTDARYKKRIDQAIKCGFPYHQIISVLKTLGTNSSMDDMMQELLKRPKEEVDIFTDSLVESESDDSDGFDVNDSSNLRHIIIDGSNVAMSHGRNAFSCMGIKIVVDWFKSRGHENITVFVPLCRKEASRPDAPITNQEILTELEQEDILVFTPSRRVAGTRIVCYDDRYVLALAALKDGIVVSNDVYRDLMRERDDFRVVVEKRLLMYSFVKDTFMPPEDPLGRQGPTLDNFLRIKPSEPKNKPQNCPYGKKCTYGNKCRYYHPERRNVPQKMVAEKLKENAELTAKLIKAGKTNEAYTEKGRGAKPKLVRTVSLVPQKFNDTPVSPTKWMDGFKKPMLQHSKSVGYPNSSSYLTESRVRMEQAESSQDFQPALTPHSQESKLEQNSLMEEKSINKHQSSSCTPSPCTSPTPTNELVKSKVKSYPSSPVPSSSAFATPIKSSLDTRYLSGHVLIAKKLSDEENKSGNFFSKHTSRPPGASQPETSLAFDDRLLSSESQSPINPVATQIKPQQEQSEDARQTDPWNSKEIYLPPDIPNQHSFKMAPVCRDERTISATTPPFLPAKEDSGFSTHSLGHQSMHHTSCPPPLPLHQTFQRALSLSTPSKPSPEHQLTRPSERKSCLNTSITKQPLENSQMRMQPQPNIQSYQDFTYNQRFTKPPPFHPLFQNSRGHFDSGISSGLDADQGMSLFSPTDDLGQPLNNSSNVPGNNAPVLSPSQNHLQSMQQHQGMMYQTTPSQFDVQVQVGGNSVNPMTGYPPSSPWQLSPLPNRMPFSPSFPFQDQNNGRMQSSGPPAMPPTHPPPYNSQVFAMQYLPTQAQSPQMQQIYSPGISNVDPQYYSMPVHNTSGNFTYDLNPPTSPYMQAPPAKPMVDEEAPISLEDPRYSIYYHLSSVYGERVVRTFMNRNPDVKGYKELNFLISGYQQEWGV